MSHGSGGGGCTAAHAWSDGQESYTSKGTYAEKPGDEFWGGKNYCAVEIVQPLVGSSFVGNTIQ